MFFFSFSRRKKSTSKDECITRPVSRAKIVVAQLTLQIWQWDLMMIFIATFVATNYLGPETMQDHQTLLLLLARMVNLATVPDVVER